MRGEALGALGPDRRDMATEDTVAGLTAPVPGAPERVFIHS